MRSKGKVYLVGAGPGDPGLLTVRGQELLRLAEVVVYDHLVSPRLLDQCRPGTRLAYAGKEAGRHTLSQARVNALLIQAARAGKTVVRLKGGDPFVFGRGGEEALALARAKVPYEVVPGVTSAIAAPAYAGIPVTHRQLASSVAFVTGHEDPTKPDTAVNWARLAVACDTLVCLMGVNSLPQIARQLARHGRRPSTPCALIEWGTWPRQRTVTAALSRIALAARRAKLKAPAVLVVGEVVSLRKRLAWFETKPLFGRRILVTRAADKAGALVEQLEALGAEVESLPAIELAAVSPNGAFRQAVHALPKTDWVFFTSPEGVGWFSRMLRARRKDLRALAGCHLAAIGPKTALSLQEAGLRVDVVPKRFSQEGLLGALPRRVLRGKRALILSAEESRDVLTQGLRRQGMTVANVPIYRTVVPRAMRERLGAALQRPADFVTATSASCAQHLHQALKASGRAGEFRRLRFASIGPVTSAALRALGGRVAVEATRSTIEGLVEAMVRHVRHR